MRIISLALAALFLLTINANAQEPTQGSLFAFDSKGKALGESPLKSTSVRVEIRGPLARVTVEQEFSNNFGKPIEAVYTFPLSNTGAVDRMAIKIGERSIRGKIMRREDADKAYEKAKKEGKTAALLDQDRPNVFSQRVANILRSERIVVKISYVERLASRDGGYEFVFPMVVAPRYSPKGRRVSSASPRIDKTRSGQNISIEVDLDAGFPLENITSPLHEIIIADLSPSKRKIRLSRLAEIPNRDFVLRYDFTGQRITDSILTESHGDGGFFLLQTAPPEDFRIEDVRPKEIVFVLDTSGSMEGFPIEKAKESMMLAIKGLYPRDRFNVITFAGETQILFERPVPATPENIAAANEFLQSRKGSGGTEMMKAIEAAFAGSETGEHLRIVCFMTDGLVSNEDGILRTIQRNPKARVFAFGIGDSVNRFLLDGMARQGRGEVEYVTLSDDGSAGARRFHRRIRNPLMTDISIDWRDLPVTELAPSTIPDLFDVKPVFILGRYRKGPGGEITIKGTTSGQPIERTVPVKFPESQSHQGAIGALWARARIEELSSDLRTSPDFEAELLKEEITRLALEFNLASQYTSFVAVEEQVRNVDGELQTVEVPVEPARGTFGDESPAANRTSGLNKVPLLGRLFQRRRNKPQAMMNLPTRIVDLELTPQKTRPEQKTIRILDPSLANTKSSPTVIDIAKLVSQHNDTLWSMDAEIELTEEEEALDESTVRVGRLRYLRLSPEKFRIRIDIEKPAESFLAADGRYLVYRKMANQALRGSYETSELGALAGFLTGKPLHKQFKLQMLSVAKVDGVKTWHLRGSPRDDGSTFEVWIDRFGMVLQFAQKRRNGDSIQFRLSNVKKNVKFEAQDFRLHVKGVKLVSN